MLHAHQQQPARMNQQLARMTRTRRETQCDCVYLMICCWTLGSAGGQLRVCAAGGVWAHCDSLSVSVKTFALFNIDVQACASSMFFVCSMCEVLISKPVQAECFVLFVQCVKLRSLHLQSLLQTQQSLQSMAVMRWRAKRLRLGVDENQTIWCTAGLCECDMLWWAKPPGDGWWQCLLAIVVHKQLKQWSIYMPNS